MLRRFFLSFLSLSLLATLPSARAAVNPQLVYDDAKVIRRVVEVTGRSVPRDLIDRIAKQDLEALRGRRLDDTYEFATYEREEASRQTEDFTVGPKAKASKQHVKADYPYRLVISAPTRRYLVRRNSPVFVERVVLEMSPFEGEVKYETIDVGEWIQPGTSKSIDLSGIERRASATVFAYVDDKVSVGSLNLALVQAKVVDKPDSPYASSVRNLKLIIDALAREDTSNLNSLANLLIADLGKRADVSPGVSVSASPARPAQAEARPPALAPAAPDESPLETMPHVEIYMELQSIEDLLTGSEKERREGMDKLHQLIRKIR